MTVTCDACGETWPRHPAKEVPCPTCNATIGSPCRRPSDHPCTIHVARDRLALATTEYDPCPTNGGETIPTAARTLLDSDYSLTTGLEQLDLTRSDLQQIATGATIAPETHTNDEEHQPETNASDGAEVSTIGTQPPADHPQPRQTTLTDTLRQIENDS